MFSSGWCDPVKMLKLSWKTPVNNWQPVQGGGGDEGAADADPGAMAPLGVPSPQHLWTSRCVLSQPMMTHSL